MINIKPDQILHELLEMQDELSKPIPTSSLDEMKEKGAGLVVYLARSAVLLAEAGSHLNEQRKKAYASLILELDKVGAKLPPSLAKDYINALCSDMSKLYDLAERTNKAITHSLDFLRSAISAEKQQLANLQYHNS